MLGWSEPSFIFFGCLNLRKTAELAPPTPPQGGSWDPPKGKYFPKSWWGGFCRILGKRTRIDANWLLSQCCISLSKQKSGKPTARGLCFAVAQLPSFTPWLTHHLPHTHYFFLNSNFHSGTFFTALGGSSHLSSSLPPCMATLVIYLRVSGISWSQEGEMPKSLPSKFGGNLPPNLR